MHVPPKSPGQRRCERENTDLSKNKSCLPTFTSLSFSFLLACTTLLLECMAPAFVSGKNAFFKQRVFSLAASWQMACKFLSNTLSLSIPWIFGEINYHWVVTKMGRQKPKPEFFVFVKQAIYIPHICPHMKSFVSVSLCSPLPPFLYYCKRNRSFLRTFLVNCQNHFDIWHLCCSWAVYVILIAEPPPRSGLLLSQNFFDIFPFYPYLLSSHSFWFILCISFWPVCSACVYV